MTHKELYTHIINWNFCFGEEDPFGNNGFIEDFFDTISYDYIYSFNLWLLKKNYLTEDKYNNLTNELLKKNKISPYRFLVGNNTDYSVFPCGTYDSDAKYKSTYIFSEYILEDEELTKSLLNFIYKDEKANKELNFRIKRWDREGANDFDEIKLLNVDEINKNIKEDCNQECYALW